MSPPMALCWKFQADCRWSVVLLDHDEEMKPMHGMSGTLDVELEGQLFCDSLGKLSVPTTTMLTTKGEGILLEVELVTAHRSKKEKQQMSLFEKFVMKRQTSWQNMGNVG